MATQNPNNELSPEMQQALKLLEAGKSVEAEETMLRAAREVRGRFGEGTQQDAVAQNELGSILLHAGQMERALEALRQSVSGAEPAGEQAMRDRLTFLMNLGQTLQMTRQFDEAEEVLHKGLQGRESFYGRQHAGYAFGLEPLSEVTFELGKSDVALAMIDEVVKNFWSNGHPRIAGAIAIRARMAKSTGKAGTAFGGLEKLPDDIIIEIGKQAVARLAHAEDLKISREVLSDLIYLLSNRLGESHAQTINALIAMSNIERKLGKDGDPLLRQKTIERLTKIFDTQGKKREALQSVMALALAYGDAGASNRAAETYEEAISRVEALGDLREKSQVLRNYGLLLVEMKRDADAERQLTRAVAEAEKSGDKEMTALALIALGIFIQHAGRLDEAKPMLARSLTLIDPAHPHALMGRSHLQAIETKGSCGCGDMSNAIADAFREFVMSRAPAGLLKRLDVTLKDNDFSLDVHLDREPTSEELDHLQRVTQHALEEFRKKMRAE